MSAPNRDELAKSRGDITSYEDFQAKVLEHLEEIESKESEDYYFRVAGDITQLRVHNLGHGILKKGPAGNNHFSREERSGYYDVEELLRAYLRDLDGSNGSQTARFSLTVINMPTGAKVEAQWTWNAGSVKFGQREPRTS